jgi:hypothetical protein
MAGLRLLTKLLRRAQVHEARPPALPGLRARRFPLNRQEAVKKICLISILALVLSSCSQTAASTHSTARGQVGAPDGATKAQPSVAAPSSSSEQMSPEEAKRLAEARALADRCRAQMLAAA